MQIHQNFQLFSKQFRIKQITYTQTTIYDLTGGKKPGSLAKLKRAIPDASIDDTLPASLQGTAVRDAADFLVILGSAEDDRS